MSSHLSILSAPEAALLKAASRPKFPTGPLEPSGVYRLLRVWGVSTIPTNHQPKNRSGPQEPQHRHLKTPNPMVGMLLEMLVEIL